MQSLIEAYIHKLQLQPHPEGGHYRETYRSELMLHTFPDKDANTVPRHVSTGIHFLLGKGEFSAFHKIRSDEMWHFYAGSTLEIFELRDSGELVCTRLGPDILQGELLQYVVPAKTWFASRVAAGGEFSLVGCTVAPGFHFDDFTLADRQDLLAAFPQHKRLIAELTRA